MDKALEALDIEQLSRELAVAAIDGVHGFTMENASSPAYHAECYDLAQNAIKYVLEQHSATIRSALTSKGEVEKEECGSAQRLDNGLSGLPPEETEADLLRGVLGRLPAAWELEAAAIFLDHVEDDETDSAANVANFLRDVATIAPADRLDRSPDGGGA